jgi:hypothetical protein
MPHRTRQRGQSMVEFGILALLFTLIMFAIADFGMLLNGWVAVSSAAREGGRRAALGMSVTQVASAARNFAAIPGTPPSTLKVHATYCNPDFSTCVTWCSGYYSGPKPAACLAHPVTEPAEPELNAYPNPAGPPPQPQPGWSVKVNVIADKFEVITPLVRPFFQCDSTDAHCYVPIISSTTVFFEGPRP